MHGPTADSFRPQFAPSIHLSGIPLYPQEELQCGPASLASVLSFWGQPVTPEEIAAQIYSSRLQGTFPLDMAAYAETYGGEHRLSIRVIRDKPEVFKEEITSGHPLVVFVDLGVWVWKKGHFMVLVGYDDTREGVIVHSGTVADKFIPYTVFLRQWSKTGYWTLRIVPADGRHES